MLVESWVLMDRWGSIPLATLWAKNWFQLGVMVIYQHLKFLSNPCVLFCLVTEPYYLHICLYTRIMYKWIWSSQYLSVHFLVVDVWFSQCFFNLEKCLPSWFFLHLLHCLNPKVILGHSAPSREKNSVKWIVIASREKIFAEERFLHLAICNLIQVCAEAVGDV